MSKQKRRDYRKSCRKDKRKKANKVKARMAETADVQTPVADVAKCPDISIACLSPEAANKMICLVEGDPRHECGALLIGNLLTDRISGLTVAYIDDIYTDGQYGGSADYTFTSKMQVEAMSYIFQKYRDTKHMIGTVHSHARFPAFYSDVDYKMMNSRKSEEVHMVISPSQRTYVLTYKDLDFEYHEKIELRARDPFPYERRYI